MARSLSQSAPNVLVTRTFSKIYGLAGERIGWGTGPKPWSTCSTAFAGRSMSR
jgi:histidinol-phosphate/aromatic aminotransferase/cobyric acid decarboxylase-like protein